jgi:hypothetical protein
MVLLYAYADGIIESSTMSGVDQQTTMVRLVIVPHHMIFVHSMLVLAMQRVHDMTVVVIRSASRSPGHGQRLSSSLSFGLTAQAASEL